MTFTNDVYNQLRNVALCFETLFFNKTFIAYVCLEIYFKKFVDNNKKITSKL